MSAAASFTAFAGHRMLASGDLRQVAAAVAKCPTPALILDDATGALVELDLRQGPEHAAREFQARTAAVDPVPPAKSGRGRPRLGVVAREVTLLPRHWDWLASQPGGASAALRRLVDEARRANAGPDEARRARDAIYRAMTVLGGDLPGFEEACRALFAGDSERLRAQFEPWPRDVATYLQILLDRRPAG